MAHSLRLAVVAEGVETSEQLAFLQQHGCDFVQGFLFSRAVPGAEIPALLTSGAREPSPAGEAVANKKPGGARLFVRALRLTAYFAALPSSFTSGLSSSSTNAIGALSPRRSRT